MTERLTQSEWIPPEERSPRVADTGDRGGTSSPEPDWVRLQKALAVEAEKGFNNLEGKQHRFHEFLRLSFEQVPDLRDEDARRRWRAIADQFGQYPDMTFAQRQHLIAETRRFLHQTRKQWEAKSVLSGAADPSSPSCK